MNICCYLPSLSQACHRLLPDCEYLCHCGDLCQFAPATYIFKNVRRVYVTMFPRYGILVERVYTILDTLESNFAVSIYRRHILLPLLLW